MKHASRLALLFAIAAASLVGDSPSSVQTCSAAERPNIIVIMSDDMGYSDIGCYGGEIETPTLNGLAENGLRFTQFYNTGRCCPTRGSLLTGLYPHQSGIGWMMTDRGHDGYRGDLNNNCRTMAEVLKPAGYSTYGVGKWHVTKHIQPDGPKHNWPRQRGFDRFYGTITGAGSFFDPGTLTRDNQNITPWTDSEYKPEQYYYTDAISDNAVKFINEHCEQDADKPFFMYVTYTAAHWPMHALEKDIAKYKGRYDGGYAPVRNRRAKRVVELGLVIEACEPAPLIGEWENVEHQAWEARCMEVYAAMIDNMDQGIGRIVGSLKENNKFDNTLIVFMQDNGGCQEGNGRQGNFQRPVAASLPKIPLDQIRLDVVPKQNRAGVPTLTGPGIMPGPEDTYIAYGLNWANVSNTPFREYKHFVHEGGISTPLIAHWPAGIKRRGELEHQPGHLVDIMATCVDLSEAEYPEQIGENKIKPLEGVSLNPAFSGKSLNRKQPLFWEHEGNRAIRDGDWKLVAKENKPWELYDLRTDRSETHNLAAEKPELAKELEAKWDAYAARANVLPLGTWRGASKKPKANRKQRKFSLKSGDNLSSEDGPFIEDRPLKISVELKKPGTDGVLVAHGGTAEGYSLYLRNGILTFATRRGGKLSKLETNQKLSSDATSVVADLSKTGDVTLSVNGNSVATGNFVEGLPRHPIDGLQVGSDEGGFVGEYNTPFPFTGEIASVTIDLK
ncbi:MAG: arylsulfatase [Planctomycetota bacterium]|nr:arylsulfatase [Planctomycetota bacterium]MDA1160537.1 arylsulfatase [Planctomycetota bacterium]